MSLFARLRAELIAARAMYRDDMDGLVDALCDATDPAEQARALEEWAYWEEVRADRLERSWLARAVTALPSPAELRAEAARMRADAAAGRAGNWAIG